MLGLSTGLERSSFVGSEFNPKSSVNSNLALWLDNNVNISAAVWQDASGNSNNVTAIEEFEPSVQGGGWHFNPGEEAPNVATLGSSITASSQEGFMAFFVIDHDANDQRTLLGTGGTAEFIEIMNSKKIRIKIDGTTSTPTFAANQFVNDTKYILGIKRDAGSTGNLHIYKNGTLLTPTSQLANTGAIAFSAIGARGDTGEPGGMDRAFDGHLYELLIYEGATELTSGEITKIHNFLASAHGL